MIASRFSWRGLAKDVRSWVRSSVTWQRAKVHKHTKAPTSTFSLPDARFSHVHVDLVGPLPLSLDQRYLRTYVDRYTRWPEAIPIPDITAETVVHAFLLHWVASFGVPQYITTDRGQQFKSSTFRGLCAFLGCSRLRTTAYQPAASGLVERFHHHLKGPLRAQSNPDRWVENVPLVLLGCRAAVKSVKVWRGGPRVRHSLATRRLRFPRSQTKPTCSPAFETISEIRGQPPSVTPSAFSSGPTTKFLLFRVHPLRPVPPATARAV